MSDFRPYPVGLRVIGIKSKVQNRVGKIGTVIHPYGHYPCDRTMKLGYIVEFDSLPAPDGEKEGWFCEHRHLVPLSDPDADIEAEDAVAALDAAYSREAV